MDIHNTESTNLLLSSSEIKFYLTYKDFMDNYPKHLKKWLELQSPYGEEKDFKKEYLEIYKPFFEDCREKGINCNGFWAIHSEIFFERYDNVFLDISIYNNFLKYEMKKLLNEENNPSEVLTPEYAKYTDVKYMGTDNTNLKLKNYYFTYKTRKVLNTFFEWNEENQTISFYEYKYKNFTKNIEKIVRFLLSEELYTDNNPLSESNAPKKETLHFEPLPVSEPKPQRTEPTQEPQPVPNFGEAQPVPVVSEEPQPEDITPLQWNGTDIEFIELAKALEVSGVVTSEKHPFINIVRVLKKAFNFELQNHYKKANDIKLRKIGGETLFLDKLQKELKDKWINKEK